MNDSEILLHFVDLGFYCPDLVIDARYASDNNFVGRPIKGYESPRLMLSLPAAKALSAVQDDIATHGLALKIFDAYRPQCAVDNFLAWAKNPQDAVKQYGYYPDIPKVDLFSFGYLLERSSHTRGSTVDLTVVDQAGQELDMGTCFDFFGPQSNVDYPHLTPEQSANRHALAAAMRRHGFTDYPSEWWHFTLEEEPYPDTYFTFTTKEILNV